MLFSSMIFLWLFLPFVLVVNLVLPIRLSSFFLLAMSFIFYAWGEQEYIWLLLLSLIVNYAGALGMEAVRGSRPAAGTGPEATGTGAAGAGAAGGSCWSGRGYGRGCRQYSQPDSFRCRQAHSLYPG